MNRKLISLILSKDPLSPSQLGWVVGELVKREQAPGGPYALFNDPASNTIFNRKISQFIDNQRLVPMAAQHLSYKCELLLEDRYLAARNHILSLPKALQETLLFVLEKIKTSDLVGEIGLLSTYFYKSYLKNIATENLTDLARQLDIANILAWVSYTLYDEVVDDPSSDTAKSVPAANAILRTTQFLFHELGCSNLANELLNEVDTAMAEEALRNTFSKNIASSSLHDAMSKKSIAHVIGPLYLSSYIPSIDLVQLRSAFAQYCAARQLLDDIHDWQDDLSKDQYTYANYLMRSCRTPKELLLIKRDLISEVLSIANKATDLLNHTLSINADPCIASPNLFTSVSFGRIADVATGALAYDTATSEAISSYAKTIKSLQHEIVYSKPHTPARPQANSKSRILQSPHQD